MSAFEDVQSFIDISRSLCEPRDLNGLLQSAAREMGFDHFALIHHVDLSPFENELGHMARGQLIALSDYPEDWVAEYIGDGIVSRDPVLLASHRTNIGFAWPELPKLIDMQPDHYELLERTRRAGIGSGFTVPSNVPGEVSGSCNFVVRTGRELPRESFMTAQLIGSYAFEAARSIVTHAQALNTPKVKLTPRQVECIALVARGKTDWEIATILGISQGTVKKYLEDARLSYQVSKRVQVVLRAVYEGHLPLSEVLR